MPKKILGLLFALFAFINLNAQQNIDSLITYYKAKADNYLVKDSSLYDLIQIDSTGIHLFTPVEPEDTAISGGIPVVRDKDTFYIAPLQGFNWEALEDIKENYNQKPPYQKIRPQIDSLPLKGIRIALDPGHVAWNWKSAKWERKWVSFDKSNIPGVDHDIKFYEANLNLSTALILKEKLEAAGAIVFMTRDTVRLNSLDLSFEEWKKDHIETTLDSALANEIITERTADYIRKKPKDRELFRYLFYPYERYYRSRLINNFEPDITLFIHYNVDVNNSPWEKPTDTSLCMTFIPGAFMEGELDKIPASIEFMRLLLSNEIYNSIELNKHFINSMADNLNVGIADSISAPYLGTSCLYSGEPGVYCRNLQLSRLVHGTTVYLEPLYQDALSECTRLYCEDIDKLNDSERVKEVADAYYQAILNYFTSY